VRLEDKPFTKALLLRGSYYIDEEINDLKNWAGRLKNISEDNTIEQLFSSCAKSIAYHITLKATEKIGKIATFLSLFTLHTTPAH
jgi:hypothetical protein